MIAFREPVTVTFQTDSYEGSFVFTFHDDDDRELFTVARDYPAAEGIYGILVGALAKRIISYVFDEDARALLERFQAGEALGTVRIHAAADLVERDRASIDHAEWLPGTSFRDSTLRLTLGEQTIDLPIGVALLFAISLARQVQIARDYLEARDRRDHPEDFED